MEKISQLAYANKVSTFSKLKLTQQEVSTERTIRLIRWFIILLVVFTFPLDHPKTTGAYIILGVFSIYNITRYSKTLFNNRFLASKALAAVMDNIFIGSFLFYTGALGTSYAIFLFVLVIFAVYWTGIRGLILTVVLQITIAISTYTIQGYEPLIFGPAMNAITGGANLIIIGLLTERLTHGVRLERETLRNLSDQLQAGQARLLVLINSLTDAIFVINHTGHIIFYNGAALALLDTNEELSNKELPKLLELKDKDGKRINLLELAKSGHGTHSRNDLAFHLGQNIIALDIRMAAVHLGNQLGSPADYIIVCRDITKEKSLDDLRNEFISVASHELRTPLAIAEAALSTAMMPKWNNNQEVNILLEQTYRNITFLSQLITDLTTLASAQNDRLAIQLEIINIKELMKQLAEDYQEQLKQKSLKFKLEIGQNLPELLTTKQYLLEILENYMTNAIKYTQEGQITLGVKTTTEKKILFYVSDTGIGISNSDQRKLFTKFYRSEDYRIRETGGTGLGLYLCRTLATRMNAKVWCESELNKGTTFYLELPPVSKLKRDRRNIVEASTSILVDEL
jgi:signal transduction histidine kinase